MLLAACSQNQSTDSENVEKVVVSEAFHSLLYLPLYVARNEGIFNKHHIDVTKINSAGSGPTALASVLSNESQFSLHGPEHVAFAKEKGGDARAVSAAANSAPVWVLARKDANINSLEDLRGKHIVVGLAPGTSNTLLKRLLAENGIDIKKDVTVEEVQNGSEIGPVVAKKADVAVAYQPQIEQGISQGLEIVYDFTEQYPEYAFSTFNTSTDIIKNNPQLVEHFVAATQEALDLIHNDPDKAKEVARKEFSQLSPDVVDAAVDRMIKSNVYPKSTEITSEALTNALDIQKYVGNLKTDVPFDEMIDNQFTKD